MSPFQHLNLKFFATAKSTIDADQVVPALHRIIQQASLPGVLIDVTSYAHVPKGPGVVLVGHDAIWSVDHGKGEWGALFQQRSAFVGTPGEALLAAWSGADAFAKLLEGDPLLGGALTFSRDEALVTFNDRGLAPNTPATVEAVLPELTTFFQSVWPQANPSLSLSSPDARERLSFRATRG